MLHVSRRNILHGLMGVLGCAVMPPRVFGDASFAVRILFIANTFGLTGPCPTCGKKALGGLARRASILKKFRADGIPSLYVAGPYEIAPHDAASLYRLKRVETSAPISVGAMCAAHTLCKPDIACAMRSELMHIGRAPNGFDVVGKTSVIRRKKVGGIDCAFVIFPEKPKGTDSPDTFMINAVINAGMSVADADLVIGISGWGIKAESYALSRFEGVFDILLGAGSGAPFPIDIPRHAPSILWIRSDSEGRTLIEILCSPDIGGRPRSWIRGIDVQVREIPLDAAVPDDMAIKRILQL